MNQGTVFIIMAGCVLFILFEGAKIFRKIPTYHHSAEEAEKIFNMRVFEKEEDIKSKLNLFFGNIERSLMTASFCFVFAYVMVSLMSKMAWQWSWKQSFGLVLVFFMVPFGVIYATFNENRLLKKEIMDKFKAS